MKHPIDTALQIATKAHEGQTDRDGYSVILHPIAVGMMGDTDEEKILLQAICSAIVTAFSFTLTNAFSLHSRTLLAYTHKRS